MASHYYDVPKMTIGVFDDSGPGRLQGAVAVAAAEVANTSTWFIWSLNGLMVFIQQVVCRGPLAYPSPPST